MNRRTFLDSILASGLPAIAAMSLGCGRAGRLLNGAGDYDATPFRIALNQWSLWNEYVGDSSADDWWDIFLKALRSDPRAILKGSLDPLDFPKVARERYGLDAVELEASLYFAHAADTTYFNTLRRNCEQQGVACLLMSNVWSGNLAAMQGKAPRELSRNYHPWVDAAAILGCHSLMVDVNGRRGDRNDVKEAAVEGLSALVEYAAPNGITILIENHGWYSSYVPWLIDIVRTVDSPFCKLNVDLGNFCRTWRGEECVDQQYDPYEGVALMMPYAKAVSAKMIRFDDKGNETRTDYVRMLRIIQESGYRGYLGVEYAGEQVSGDVGVRTSIDLIRRAESQL